MVGKCKPAATSLASPPVTCHSSQLSLPDHPFLVLVPSIRVCIRLAIILGICLWFSPVRSGRALCSGIRLGEYHAISITLHVNDRHETKFPAGPTSAFGAVGELEGRRLRTCGLGILGDMSQHKDNRAQWTVCTASPLVTT